MKQDQWALQDHPDHQVHESLVKIFEQIENKIISQTADAPLLPPELLFRMNNGEANKGEDRMRRDVEFVSDDFLYDDETLKYPTDEMVDTHSKSKTKKKSKSTKKEELGNKFVDMYSTIYAMKQEMDRIRRPVGTKDNPVRTCKDLYFGHPQFEDGKASIKYGKNAKDFLKFSH